jgi:hypothetical protein
LSEKGKGNEMSAGVKLTRTQIGVRLNRIFEENELEMELEKWAGAAQPILDGMNGEIGALKGAILRLEAELHGARNGLVVKEQERNDYLAARENEVAAKRSRLAELKRMGVPQ